MRKKQVVMPMADLIREHNRLVHILRSGDREARLREARKQSAEIKKYK
jgi:hypothetical protein